MSSSYFLFIILLFTCLYIVQWSFQKTIRLYQFPFFMCMAFLSYIVPQLYALIGDPYPVSPDYVDLTIFLTILCMVLFFYGYTKQSPNIEVCDYKRNSDLFLDKRIFYLGIIYTIIGFLCNVAIGNVDIEQQKVSQWTGILTIYAFFQGLLYIGFAINLHFALRKNNFLYWLMFSFSAFWPIFTFLFYARRTDAIIYITIVMSTLWFVRGYIASRPVIFISAILGFFFLNAVSAYRSELGNLNIGYSNWKDFFSFTWFDSWSTAFKNVDWWDQSTKLFQTSDTASYGVTIHSSETKFAASVIQITNETGQFGYGTQFWNRIVFGFIPAQFLGTDFKESWYLSIAKPLTIRLQDYFSTQTFSTGYVLPIMGELFSELWFFGFFICYLIGQKLKILWLLVNQEATISNQIIYPLLLALSVSLCLAGFAGYLYLFIVYTVFLIPIRYIESKKPLALKEDTKI